MALKSQGLCLSCLLRFTNRLSGWRLWGMQRVLPQHRRLPAEFYARAVAALPLVCIDVMCRRESDGALLPRRSGVRKRWQW